MGYLSKGFQVNIPKRLLSISYCSTIHSWGVDKDILVCECNGTFQPQRRKELYYCIK